MASKLDICNLALVRLGSLPILSLDDPVKRAQTLKKIFDLVRDIVLRDHPWNFAVRRDTLAQLAEAPAFGYSYAYQLPSGCLRVLGMVGLDENIDTTLEYKLEDQKLLTNESGAQIKYIIRVEDTGLFDSRFCSALASRLAAEAAYQIKASAAMKKQMMDEYRDELSGARSIDAQEDTPEVAVSNPWIEARI